MPGRTKNFAKPQVAHIYNDDGEILDTILFPPTEYVRSREIYDADIPDVSYLNKRLSTEILTPNTPFTIDQEKRIREIVAEVVIDALRKSEGFYK